MNLFDTSIIIKMLREKQFQIGAISVITLIEILRGISASKRKVVKELLEESFEIITIDNGVILEYCKLYKNLKADGLLLPDADLLIAASAKAHNMKLITMDRDFERLRNYGLKIEIVKSDKGS